MLDLPVVEPSLSLHECSYAVHQRSSAIHMASGLSKVKTSAPSTTLTLTPTLRYVYLYPVLFKGGSGLPMYNGSGLPMYHVWITPPP